jgi:hypothetical protein
MAKWLRFTTTRIDEDSRKPEGVFMAAYSLLRSGELSLDEWKHLRETLDWFEENLPAPPEDFRASRAIFWFQPNAHDCLDRVWDMIDLLRRHGYHVTVYKCPSLGNICYRDKYQVAAYPSDRDGKITMQ